MAKMNKNMTIDSVVDEFLAEVDSPSAELWDKLASKYPEYANEITDFAIIYSGMNDLSESDVNTELGQDVYDVSVSNALEMALQFPNVISPVRDKLTSIRGKSFKNLVKETGLEKAPKLLQEILQGVTLAPKKVLEKLATKFDTNEVVVMACLQNQFANAEVPSYKATGDKPEVSTRQRTWVESVRLLNLSEEDTALLLLMDE